MNEFWRKLGHNWGMECTLAYLALVALNLQFWPDNPAFLGMTNPHPYLFVVLLLATRYGATAGTVSGLVGATLHWVWAYPEARIQVWGEVGPAIQQALVLSLSGLAVGFVRTRYIWRERDQTRALAEHARQIESLQNQLHVLNEVNHELEARMLNEVQSFASLYHISARLERLEVGDILGNVPAILAEYLKAERCSVYLCSGEVLELRQSYGWDENMSYRREIPLAKDNSMLGRACRDRQTLSIREFLDAPDALDSLGESVMCSPILNEQGELLGALNVESMPFLRITRSSVTVIDVMGRWVGQAVTRAMRFEAIRAHSIKDERFGVCTRRYLEQRLGEEFSRAQTYYLPMALAVIYLEHGPEQPWEAHQQEIETIVSYLQVACRPTDVVARFGEDCPLAVLYTTTSLEEASERAGKLRSDLNRLLPQRGGRRRVEIGLSGFQTGQTEWREMLQMAEQSLAEALAKV